MDRKLFQLLPLSCFLSFISIFFQACPQVINSTLESPGYPSYYTHRMDCNISVPIPFGHEHKNRLWALLHASLWLELQVNDLRWFRTIMMSHYLRFVGWVRNLRTGYLVMELKRSQWARQLFLLRSSRRRLYEGFANQLLQGWWEGTRDEFFFFFFLNGFLRTHART